MNKIHEIIEMDDFELEWIKRNKIDPLNYPLDIGEMKKVCEEILYDCESGMYLGENYHGGMTREEWKRRKEYIENVLKKL